MNGSIMGVDAGHVFVYVVQFGVQPSPYNALPSSHCSVPATMPSPQTVTQVKSAATVYPDAQLSQTLRLVTQAIQLVSMQGGEIQELPPAPNTKPVSH